MKTIALLAALGLAATTVGAAEDPIIPLAQWEADRTAQFDAAEVDLETFRWRARPVIVFADSPLDPAFQTQIEFLTRDIEEAVERDIVILTDTDPAARSELRQKLRPRGFMMVLIGKDGGVKLRKPFPWDMREIGRTIDKMPMRQREIEDRRAERAAGQ